MPRQTKKPKRPKPKPAANRRPRRQSWWKPLRYDACDDGLAFAKQYRTAQEAWDDCDDYRWMSWAASFCRDRKMCSAISEMSLLANRIINLCAFGCDISRVNSVLAAAVRERFPNPPVYKPRKKSGANHA